jgi:hypothetical protein
VIDSAGCVANTGVEIPTDCSCESLKDVGEIAMAGAVPDELMVVVAVTKPAAAVACGEGVLIVAVGGGVSSTKTAVGKITGVAVREGVAVWVGVGVGSVAHTSLNDTTGGGEACVTEPSPQAHPSIAPSPTRYSAEPADE